MRISAGVDQLGVYVQPCTGLSDATFQHVRHLKSRSDLTRVLFAAKSHNASAADYLQVGNLRQFGQDVVLNTIGKRSVLSIVAQIFKWQHRNSRRSGMLE